MGSGRGWLAGDWPSTGGVLNITAAVWTAGFHWWHSGNKKRTQNVSEYMLVLALCLVQNCKDKLFYQINPFTDVIQSHVTVPHVPQCNLHYGGVMKYNPFTNNMCIYS